MWGVHPAEEAGLLKAGRLPPQRSLCGEAGEPYGRGKNSLTVLGFQPASLYVLKSATSKLNVVALFCSLN